MKTELSNKEARRVTPRIHWRHHEMLKNIAIARGLSNTGCAEVLLADAIQEAYRTIMGRVAPGAALEVTPAINRAWVAIVGQEEGEAVTE